MAQKNNNNAASIQRQWESYAHLWKPVTVPAKTILLKEGIVSKKAYFIEKGCLRVWFNNNGKEVTLQFFFENQGVSSIESFRTGEPSLYTIETIEPCTLRMIHKKDFDKILATSPELERYIYDGIFERMLFYQKLFLSRIKDTPPQRYQDLLQNHPQIVQRVPQQYIASYLGITPVSLSRIRNNSIARKKRK